MKKTLLELGGKSTHIICDDADFAACLPMAGMMACVMSGQSCILSSRVLLPRSRYAEGIEVLKTIMENFPVGDPWTPGIMQGPQISETQRQKTLGLVQSAVAEGATLVTGGGIRRTFRSVITCNRPCSPTSTPPRPSPRPRSSVR